MGQVAGALPRNVSHAAWGLFRTAAPQAGASEGCDELVAIVATIDALIEEAEGMWAKQAEEVAKEAEAEAARTTAEAKAKEAAAAAAATGKDVSARKAAALSAIAAKAAAADEAAKEGRVRAATTKRKREMTKNAYESAVREDEIAERDAHDLESKLADGLAKLAALKKHFDKA